MGWVVAKAKIKMQSDTIIEFRVVMTCMNPERENILFHYKALIAICESFLAYIRII